MRVHTAAEALENERALAADLQRRAEAAHNLVNPPAAKEDGDHVLDGDDDFPNGTAVYEAASVAHLHAQAAGVQNIRSLVFVVLDPLSTNYNRWRDLVLLTLECYALTNHVLSDATYPGLPA